MLAGAPNGPSVGPFPSARQLACGLDAESEKGEELEKGGEEEGGRIDSSAASETTTSRASARSGSGRASRIQVSSGF